MKPFRGNNKMMLPFSEISNYKSGGGVGYLTQEELIATEDLIKGDFIQKMGNKAEKVQLIKEDFIQYSEYNKIVIDGTTPRVVLIEMLTDTKFVMVYNKQIGNEQLFATVGDIDLIDGSILYGSEYAVFNSGANTNIFESVDMAALDETRIFLVVNRNTGSSYHRAVVLSVSGTVVSVGTDVTFDGSGACRNTVSVCKIDTNKVMVIADNQSNNEGIGAVATISGTTIIFGSVYIYTSGSYTTQSDIVTLDTDKVAFRYRTFAGANVVKIATISGTAITYGIDYSRTGLGAIGVLKNDKILIYDSAGFATGDILATNISFNTSYAGVTSVGKLQVFTEKEVFSNNGTIVNKVEIDNDVITIGSSFLLSSTFKGIRKISDYRLLVFSYTTNYKSWLLDAYHKFGFATSDVLETETGKFATENKLEEV